MKLNLNDKNKEDYGFFVEKVVITEANLLSKVDTACFIATNGTVFKLNTTFDSDKNVLNITTRSDQDKT